VHTKGTRTRNAVLPLALVAGLTLAAGLTALTAAAPAGALDPTALTGGRTSSGFYPCPANTDGGRPFVSECTQSAPSVDQALTECDPAGVSTIAITRTHDQGAFSLPGLGNGTFEETITAQIGPQIAGPFVPEFQPFEGSGFFAWSLGFRAGALQSFTSDFQIELKDGGGNVYRTITGTKTLTPDAANTGVCREFDGNTPLGEHAWLYSGLVPDADGYYYAVNAQVLAYEITSDTGGPEPATGVAQTYMQNSYATSGGNVLTATGGLVGEFGTTNPVVHTYAPTPVSSTQLTVEPAPGIELTFPNVANPGATTTVTSILDITDVQPPPADLKVGDPPLLWDIETNAEFNGDVKVCVPYGFVPVGETPQLYHYNEATGEWDNITITPADTVSGMVCGNVSSFSPFLVGTVPAGPSYALTGPFHPVDAFPTPNAMQAGQTVPVKFSLGGDYGLEVFESEYPKSVASTCGTTAPDPVESTSANSSGLVYDATTGVYTYNWKTNKLWKGCRTLTMLFRDGSSFQANFKFT